MEIVETIFCLTVRHMSSPQNITVGTCVSLNRFCNGMDFNEKYIVVPMMQPLNSDDDDCDIQLYSLSTLELVRTLKGCTQVITGFRLLGSFIITGSHDQMIRWLYLHIIDNAAIIEICNFRFWDMETGECKRTIKDDEMISCLGFVDLFVAVLYILLFFPMVFLADSTISISWPETMTAGWKFGISRRQAIWKRPNLIRFFYELSRLIILFVDWLRSINFL